jgi:hypothetical protein
MRIYGMQMLMCLFYGACSLLLLAADVEEHHLTLGPWGPFLHSGVRMVLHCAQMRMTKLEGLDGDGWLQADEEDGEDEEDEELEVELAAERWRAAAAEADDDAPAAGKGGTSDAGLKAPVSTFNIM